MEEPACNTGWSDSGLVDPLVPEIACSGQSHSNRSIRSSRERLEARFFFEPRQLGGQFANLGVEFIDLLFVVLFHFRDAFTIIDKQL